jgi:hypothetical protein
MFKLTTLFHKALFALMLAITAASATAGPTYHVSVNTTSLAAQGTGYLDFLLAGNVPAAETIVTLSNFSGAFGADAGRSGGVTGALPGMVTLINSDSINYLTQAVTFGGLFGFDVTFGGDYQTVGGSDGATFGVSIFNADMSAYLGLDVVSFALVPAFGGAPAAVNVAVDAALASAVLADPAQVPEPSEWLLMLTGLALMGAMLRRRSR